MARWLSLLLIAGLASAGLPDRWGERLSPTAPLAADVHETLPAEAEEATVTEPAPGSAPSRSVRAVPAAATEGRSRPAPNLRPPR